MQSMLHVACCFCKSVECRGEGGPYTKRLLIPMLFPPSCQKCTLITQTFSPEFAFISVELESTGCQSIVREKQPFVHDSFTHFEMCLCICAVALVGVGGSIHSKSECHWCHWCHWCRQFFGISAQFQTDNAEPIQSALYLETAKHISLPSKCAILSQLN